MAEDVKAVDPATALNEVRAKVEEKVTASLAAKMDELKEQVNSQIRALAAEMKPKVEVEGPVSEYRTIRDAMVEKRAITVNGTGAVKVVNDIILALSKKTSFIQKFSYFAGRDASTVIPVFSTLPAAPAAQSEGATSISADATAVLGATTIMPKAQVAILPVSAEALVLSGADVEGKLNEIFANAYARTIAAGSLTGDGTGNNMLGMFVDSALSNDVSCGATGAPKLADILKLALEVQTYADDAAILINQTFVSGFLSETTSDLAWLKDEIGRSRTVLGVPLIITGWAPTTITAGSVVAVAGPLSNYAVGMAQEFRITPIRVKGDTNTYFQAEAFFNGKPILAENGWQLKTIL